MDLFVVTTRDLKLVEGSCRQLSAVGAWNICQTYNRRKTSSEGFTFRYSTDGLLNYFCNSSTSANRLFKVEIGENIVLSGNTGKTDKIMLTEEIDPATLLGDDGVVFQDNLQQLVDNLAFPEHPDYTEIHEMVKELLPRIAAIDVSDIKILSVPKSLIFNNYVTMQHRSSGYNSYTNGNNSLDEYTSIMDRMLTKAVSEGNGNNGYTTSFKNAIIRKALPYISQLPPYLEKAILAYCWPSARPVVMAQILVNMFQRGFIWWGLESDTAKKQTILITFIDPKEEVVNLDTAGTETDNGSTSRG